MDPITDHPPPITTDHFTAAPPPAATTQTHPPYPEMITAAITALKDKDGSSRQAISKYIEKHFANLPPTHSTLLTHHLKRLKNLGQLVMVKHSYMIPPPVRSTEPQTNYQHLLEFGGSATSGSDANVGFGLENSGSVKRKPGRPPKLKPVPGLGLGVQVQNQLQEVQPYDGGVRSYEARFIYDDAAGGGQDLGGNYGSGTGSGPLLASLGLGDDGAVIAPQASPLPAPPASENAQTPVVVKRGRGRPPKSGGGGASGGGGKIQAQVAEPGGGGEIQVVEVGLGRPSRKLNGVRVKRGRGRPKRIGFEAVTVPLSGNYLRPRGRPKRVVRPKVGAVNGGGEGVSGSRRRGRPSRNTIGDFLGRPLGSISKGGPGTAVIVTDPHQLVVYQELKSKYERLQSKVKLVASVVKSCIDPNYGNTALGALQELENLASEVNA